MEVNANLIHRLRLLLLIAIPILTGCSIAKNAIPATQLSQKYVCESKDCCQPIDFRQLRRQPVRDHIIGPGDVLGVHIEEVVPVENQLPSVFYPRDGSSSEIEVPSVGHPIKVRSDGTIALPHVGHITLEGMTIPKATEKVRQIYMAQKVLSSRHVVAVELIRARTIKVFVVREDTGPTNPALARREEQLIAKRGTTHALELPIFENDVLHALSQSGGLPGIDGYNELWVLRSTNMAAMDKSQLLKQLEDGTTPEQLPDGLVHDASTEFIRIPLRVRSGQEVPFGPDDIILEDGDVVFIESRDTEYFLTGGLIDGGKYPLPRDHDIDVLEAIAIANTRVMGPSGNSQQQNFRNGPGNVVSPTRAIVVRRIVSGEQIKIEVDLRAALDNPRERITIMPRDLIVLKYKPHELAANIALNLVNINYVIPNR